MNKEDVHNIIECWQEHFPTAKQQIDNSIQNAAEHLDFLSFLYYGVSLLKAEGIEIDRTILLESLVIYYKRAMKSSNELKGYDVKFVNING